MSLLAYILAAVCFFLSWIEVDITHLVDAGLFFTAAGLALSSLGYGSFSLPRRNP